MRIFIPFLLVISFILAACGTPQTVVPVAQVVSLSVPDTAIPTATPIPLVPVVSETTSLLPVPHVFVFLAGQEMFEFLYLAPGYHGAYIHEIGTNEEAILFNPDLELHGASTIKVAIATVTLKVAEEKGLDIFTFVPPGQNLTIAELVQTLIVNHDESATVFLIDYINGLGYRFDDELVKLGLPGFNIGRRLTTARALGLLLEGLGANTLGLENNQFILDQLAADSVKDTATFPWAVNNSLPGVYTNMLGGIYDYDLTVPETLTNIKYVANDSGIWTTPDGHRFAIVLLGNYGSEAQFVLSQNYIKKSVVILSSLDPD